MTKPVSALSAGLRTKCPACGEGALFNGFLTVNDRCEACGTDLSTADSGDGPAVFIILIVGFIVVAAVLIVEVSYRPPYWLHAVIWLPTVLILSVGLLRPFKATMIAIQYRRDAGEGRMRDI